MIYITNRIFLGMKKTNIIIILYFQFFQVRAHMYQARSLIGSDASGLSDPFARVIIGEYCKTTQVLFLNVKFFLFFKHLFFVIFQVIDETLSPTWDELLVFTEILVYGRREDIKTNPPSVIIEIYDQDKVILYILEVVYIQNTTT